MQPSNKNLILNNKINAFYFERFKSKSVDICSVSKMSSKVLNIIYKILKKLKLKQTRYFYDDWYKNLDKYEKIIILISALQDDYNIIENIRKKDKNKKIFIYAWDSVEFIRNFKEILNIANKNKINIYSFDYDDCKKYSFKFNTIMYDKRLKLSVVDNKKYDVLFVGMLKERIKEILNIYRLFEKTNILVNFVVVSKDNRIKKLPFETTDKYIEYSNYLQMLSDSKAVLDINNPNQHGLSLRIMEALFLDKKLITTNKEILNTKFYNSNNILYLTPKTTTKELQEFMNKKFVPYSQEIKDYYSVESWVERFE